VQANSQTHLSQLCNLFGYKVPTTANFYSDDDDNEVAVLRKMITKLTIVVAIFTLLYPLNSLFSGQPDKPVPERQNYSGL